MIKMGLWGELIGFVLKFVPAQYTAVKATHSISSIFDKFKMSKAPGYNFIDCALLALGCLDRGQARANFRLLAKG